MTIDPETLMAYADGELGPLAAKRVERAIAVDPALAGQVAQHRRLRQLLAREFAEVAAAPMPDRLLSLLTAAPAIDLAAARDARKGARPRPLGHWMPRWMTGGAIAASLVLGVLVGQRIDAPAPVSMRGGTLVASGSLAGALDTQLASAQGRRPPVRMLVSFRDSSGAICRSFTGDDISGIACRSQGGWALRQTRAGGAAAATAFRQAGSPEAALMADAQGMMAGEPFDAAAEAAARARGWR